MKTYYITSAIAYPNAKPHLGHALEIIQADAVARFHRLKGEQVFFQTGTDEHGLKNWQTAQAKGLAVKEFLDLNVAGFRELYAKLDISYDQFLRTTDQTLHHPGAKKLWRALVEAGDIYKQKYRGLYCAGCESFKLERELQDGRCPDHPNREIETVEEENYFFRLSKYRDEIARLIESDQYRVVPEQRKNEILSFLQDAKDISFSRPKSSLPWGITVPGDEDHVMYVWCDALSNYITGAGYGRDEKEFARLWPADCHIIGKDILRFHAAFWPAMLLSAGIPLPKELFVHGFILSKGLKMSKSIGNVIDPFEQVARYGADRFRFYLLESMPIDTDGDYAEDLLVERVNSELVSNLANFVYRTLSFVEKNYGGKLGEQADDDAAKELERLVLEKERLALQCYAQHEFRKAIQELFAISTLGNQYLQANAPWKDPANGLPVLTTAANVVKDLSILFAPILPGFSAEVQGQLGLSGLSFDDLGFTLRSHAIGKPAIIWTRLDPPASGAGAKTDVKGATENNKNSDDKIRAGAATKNTTDTKITNTKNKKADGKTEDADGKRSAAITPAALDLVVAEIVRVEKHPDAEKLYIETLDDGSGQERVIVSGLVPYYAAEELLGKRIILVNNLKPAKLRGVLSRGMLLAAQAEGTVEVLEAPWAEPGNKAVIGTFAQGKEEISIDQFFSVKFLAERHAVTCAGQPVTVDGKQLKTTKVIDGKVA